jgi:hypothetical protein
LRPGERSIWQTTASLGAWILQLDTARSFSRAPAGPVAKIAVRIG